MQTASSVKEDSTAVINTTTVEVSATIALNHHVTM